MGLMDKEAPARSLYAAIDTAMTSMPVSSLRDVQSVSTVAGARLLVRDLFYKSLGSAGAASEPVLFLVCNETLLTFSRDSRPLSGPADQAAVFAAAEVALIVHGTKEVPARPLTPEAVWAAGSVGASPGVADAAALPRRSVLGSPVLDVSYVDLVECRASCSSEAEYMAFIPAMLTLLTEGGRLPLTSIARPPIVLGVFRSQLLSHAQWRESGAAWGGAGVMPRNAWQRKHRLRVAGDEACDEDGLFRPSFLLPLFPDVFAGLAEGTLRVKAACRPVDWILRRHPGPQLPKEAAKAAASVLPPPLPPLVDAFLGVGGVDSQLDELARGSSGISYLPPHAQLAGAWRGWVYDVLRWAAPASLDAAAALELRLVRLRRLVELLGCQSFLVQEAVAAQAGHFKQAHDGITAFHRTHAQQSWLCRMGLTYEGVERVAAVAIYRHLCGPAPPDAGTAALRCQWRTAQVSAVMSVWGLRQARDGADGAIAPRVTAAGSSTRGFVGTPVDPLDLAAPLLPVPYLVDVALLLRSAAARRFMIRAAAATSPTHAVLAEALHKSSVAEAAADGASALEPKIVFWGTEMPPPQTPRTAVVVRNVLVHEQAAFLLEAGRLRATRGIHCSATSAVDMMRTVSGYDDDGVPTDAVVDAVRAWARAPWTEARECDPAVQAVLENGGDEDGGDDSDAPPPLLPLRSPLSSGSGATAPSGDSTKQTLVRLPASAPPPRRGPPPQGPIQSHSLLPAPGSAHRPALAAQVTAVALYQRGGSSSSGVEPGGDLFLGDDCSACAVCGRTAEAVSLAALLMCGRCRGVAYCSAACQRADWKAGHKAACSGGVQK